MSTHTNTPCGAWGRDLNKSMDNWGLTVAGEFSLAITDCGTFVNGVDLGTRYEGDYKDPEGTKWNHVDSCDKWVNWQSWDAQMKKDMMSFAKSSMDALQSWFFWNWKIGNATSGTVEAPAWSYQLGLENGWIPTDPRSSIGACNAMRPRSPGGAFAKGVPVTNAMRDGLDWPPPAIRRGGAPEEMPQYVPTGAFVTLPVATATAAKGQPAATTTRANGGGWNNKDDKGFGGTGMMVAVGGCTYPDPWGDPNGSIPSPVCGAGGAGAGAGTDAGAGAGGAAIVNAAPTSTPTPVKRGRVQAVGLHMQRPPRPARTAPPS
jgi:glucan 1,3-beta-glucosidase